MFYESPFEKILRAAREREQRKNNFLAAILAQPQMSTTNRTILGNPLLPSLKAKRKNIFISFDHNDAMQVNGFKLIKSNSKHPLAFRDHSLKEPVTNRYGKPIIYSPSDARSAPVRREIISKFENSSKLVVLIGSSTYDSEWVDWEIKRFFSMKLKLSGSNTWKRIRGMRLKGTIYATIPAALGRRSTKALNWDPKILDSWLDQDSDK